MRFNRKGRLFDSVAQFVDFKKSSWPSFVDWEYPNHKHTLVCTSGGFDICHIGHIRLILESAELGSKLVVIVNGDDFLLRKKGYLIMPLKERMEVISSIKGVDFVVPWDDGSQFVDQAIKVIRPDILSKGGDRTSNNMAQSEIDICDEINCQIKYNIGGQKIQSSSWLSERIKNASNKA